jgi:hypothetical protein
MSQSTNLFQSGGTALLDRPSPDLDGAPEHGGGKGNRTALLALGGLAAVLVLGVVAYFLVFAGDATVEQPPAVEPGAGAPVAPPAEEAPVVTAPKISNKAFGRDPFKALITEPIAAVEPVATTGDTTTGTPVSVAPVTTDTSSTGSTDIGSTDTGSTDTGSTDTGSTDTTDTGSTGSTDATTRPTESSAHTFKVVEVAEDSKTITVKVDGEIYRKLEAGDVFAEYFKVILISGQVNSFQYGEEKFNVIGTEKLTIA